MQQPLTGVRVLEVAMWGFVTSAGAVLADWGADVLKVEHAEKGDPQRGLLRTGSFVVEGDLNVNFEHPNRGKRSLGLDMGVESGRQVLNDLIEQSDVFLTSLLPAARRKYSIDVEDVQAINPNIIYARGSALGTMGPESERGGYDMTAFWCRASTAASITPPDVEGMIGPPAPAYGDTISGTNLAGGIAAALFARERTGETSVVDVSLLGSGLWSMGLAIDSSLAADRAWVAPPTGAHAGMNPLVGLYQTSDDRFIYVWATKGYTEEDVLHLTASLEQNSEHIVGKGIVKKAEEQHVHLDKVANFKALPGLGVQGTLHGSEVYIAASYRYIEENKLIVPTEIAKMVKQAAKEGKTEVYLITNKKVVGALGLADIVREQSKQTIATLKSMGIKTAMITGDSDEVAAYVSKQLGLDQYFAEVKPEDKAAKVKELQKNGQKVAMVGDGINDAPALTQADIGIAIGAGTDVAIKSADIILVKSDPQDVVKVINLSKATYRKMLENLGWATGYNVFAIPLAAGVLYGAGIVLAPALGAVLMSVSTVVVAFNAQLLRRTRIGS